MSTQPKTPGLRVQWLQVGCWLYARLYHTSSDKLVRAFQSTPIIGGKRRFVRRVDEALSGFDWMASAEHLAREPGLYAAIQSITYEAGSV